MPAQVTMVAGPPHSGKTTRLLDRYRAALAENVPHSALWLAPTHRAAAAMRERLLDGGLEGCVSPGVTTFEKFAEAILQTAPEVIRPMGRLAQRQLVRRLIDRQHAAGRLRHFGPIAETGGLVELVCGWIRELKRLEIWPEHFREACRRRGLTDKDHELLEIYEAYQQALREHDLYDPEGRFWSARDWLGRCREAARPWPSPWNRLRLVVADGFTDFTRTQHEILQLLAERVEEVWVSLPLEEAVGREELFGKPRKTLAEFERRYGAASAAGSLRVEWCARPDRPAWPAMAHLEGALFADPRRRPPAPESIDGMEILASAGHQGELRTIAARVKELLISGEVRPGDVAVVLRSPGASASLAREAFGRLGVPVAVEAGEPLGRSPALRALAALLRLDQNDWPAEDLLAVLRSNYFRPPDAEWDDRTVAATERALRALQVARGRRELLAELKDANPQAALPRLAAALDELPQRATPAGCASAWRRLAERTGLLGVAAEPLDAPSLFGATDLEAWHVLIDALAEAEHLSAWLGERPPEWDRREALAALDDLLAAETLGLGGDESGRVRVLSAQSVRALRVPYLFVAGLAEQSFPMPEPPSRLYGEAEAARLIEAGLPLVARTERNGEETLLFYEVLTRASRRLVLSYPALDEKGEALSPSPYLTEVEQAFAPARMARSEHVDLSPLPPEPDPLCASDLRLRAVDAALGGDESLLAGLLRIGAAAGLPRGAGDGVGATAGLPSSACCRLAVMADNLLSALRLAWLRQQREGFGPAEGMFADEGLRGALAAEYGPETVFAATHLESYATCPFQFFLEKVLRLRPLDEFDVESDAAERGMLAHALLADFHRRVNGALGRPGSPLELPPERDERLLDEAFAAVLRPEPRSAVKQTLREVDRRVLRGWMAGYRDQLAAYERLWKDWETPPAAELFEASFGRRPRGSESPDAADAPDAADPASTSEPLECTVGDETIRVSGRIDRIDAGRAGGTPVFNVIDYKTGDPPKFRFDEAERGRQLQLPLYALAAAELLLGGRNPVPWTAGYWRLRDKGFHQAGALSMYRLANRGVEPNEAWEDCRSKLPGIVAGLAAGIRRGEFPVFHENERCTGTCPMSTVCRIGQIRALEKTWQPTRASEPAAEN